MKLSITKNKLKKAALLILLLSAGFGHLYAQCVPASTAPVTFTNITTTDETCPQSGTITINGAAGGGNVYMYEIFDGPIVRGIQSQNVFPALKGGTYKIRITGCNGKFKEAIATVVGNYLPFAGQKTTFIPDSSFKCGNTNNGMAVIRQVNNVTEPNLADTAKYKYPLQYQVSSNSDPYTGFNGVAYHNFLPVKRTEQISRDVDHILYTSVDTVRDLASGQTYYIRVTDACGVFITTTLVVPAINNIPYTFTFKTEEPYDLSGTGALPTATKSGCPQWGELAVLRSGNPVATINNSNTPFVLKITRQDNGNVIATRNYNTGPISLFGLNSLAGGNIGDNALLFDSLPRVPLNVTITDICGNVQVFPLNTPSAAPAFKLQAYSECGNGTTYFITNPIQAAPSIPLTWKIYDAAGTTVLSTFSNNIPNSNISIETYLQSASAPPGATTVPSYGIYNIVLTDNCGRKDSLQFDFQPGSSTAAAPSYTYNTYRSVCPVSSNYFTETIEQVVPSPVSYVRIVSGPAGVTYPRTVKNGDFPIGQYFDSLVVGNYQVEAGYGCNQLYTTSFTVGAPANPAITGAMAFTPTANSCANTITNGTGTIAASITNTDLNELISDYPYIRITQAPLQFLKNITHSKDGSAPVLPLGLGYYNASTSTPNGVDTNSLNVYPIVAFTQLDNTFLAGDYTFEMYGSCSGNIINTLSFTISSLGYLLPDLGASAAYVCDNGSDIKLVASPIGGNAPFKYQVKLAADPDVAYGALQTANTFSIPAGTAPGTVYSLRVVDNCGNSFVGKIPVNDFTGQFIVFPFNNCLGATARILTGFIPGATYTWTKPDGTMITTTGNEIDIVNFGPADKGTYSVTINALNGCIMRTATGVIGDDCIQGGPLPVKLESFTAAPQNGSVQLRWVVSSAIDIDRYMVEYSIDAVNFNSIGIITATNSSQYSFIHTSPIAGINYYRIKYIDKSGKSGYSDIRTANLLKLSNISVYPNPAETAVNVTFTQQMINKPAELQVFSIDGKLINRKSINTLSQTERLDVSGYANGKYVIHIVTSTEVINKTFEVIHN